MNEPPIVMSATGGLAPEATTFYSRLASLLATKWDDEYCVAMGWLRCCLSFSFLQLAIMSVWGVCSSVGHVHQAPPPIDLIWVEFNIITNMDYN